MPRHLTSTTSARTRRRLPRWLKVAVISVLVLANAAVGFVWWSIDSAESAFRSNAVQNHEVVAELVDRPVTETDPRYFLIIGSDSREGVDTELFGSFGGARGDVVMLARLDPAGGEVKLLSIPRDTVVPIDGHGEDRINAAFAYGGAPLMVKTVREAFDVPIHHYVEVDFVGFQALVDELGGVKMTFDHPARDHKSHLDVPAGEVTLDGFQALAYARSRSYQELRDGTWQSIDATDIGRAHRQQELVIAILDRLKRPSTLTETGSIVGSFAQHLTVDSRLADSSLVELAFSMRQVGGSDIETATVPTVGATRNGASVQLVDEPAAGPILEAFRSGRPMDSDTAPGIVSIRVLNGNGVSGSASRWAAQLEESGYTVEEVLNAARRRDTTVVRVEPPRSDAASALVATLGFGRVEVGAVNGAADAVVTLGADAEGDAR